MKTNDVIEKVPRGNIVNKELNKYNGTVLFPEKLEKVTKLVRNVPPPKTQDKN